MRGQHELELKALEMDLTRAFDETLDEAEVAHAGAVEQAVQAARAAAATELSQQRAMLLDESCTRIEALQGQLAERDGEAEAAAAAHRVEMERVNQATAALVRQSERAEAEAERLRMENDELQQTIVRLSPASENKG